MKYLCAEEMEKVLDLLILWNHNNAYWYMNICKIKTKISILYSIKKDGQK